jgi:hypothetical protein
MNTSIMNNTNNKLVYDTNKQQSYDNLDGLIYQSGKGFIISFDYPYQSIDNHVLLVCNDIIIISPINYIYEKTNKKECYVKKTKFLTIENSDMKLSYSKVVFGKKNIKIFYGKLLNEKLEYDLISNIIKKNECNILALDNLSDNLIDEIMKKQFNELNINTDFIIKNNKIVIGLNGY